MTEYHPSARTTSQIPWICTCASLMSGVLAEQDQDTPSLTPMPRRFAFELQVNLDSWQSNSSGTVGGHHSWLQSVNAVDLGLRPEKPVFSAHLLQTIRKPESHQEELFFKSLWTRAEPGGNYEGGETAWRPAVSGRRETESKVGTRLRDLWVVVEEEEQARC